MANDKLTITLNKGSYGAVDGLTPLNINSFSYAFAANGGTATSWTPTSITKVGGAALTGGETSVEVNGTLGGTADGNETVTVTPASAASVFDVNGNAMSASESIAATMKTNWNPADLGAKLLNWWDGTIVAGSPDVTTWADQKGSIDWTPGTAPAHNDAEDRIDFVSGDSEFLQSDANVASINRSDGGYWIVCNVTIGQQQWFIYKGTSTDPGAYFYIKIHSDGRIRVGGNEQDTIGATYTIQTDDILSSGKNIIEVKFTSGTLTIKVNNVSKTWSFNSGTVVTWEDSPVLTPDLVRMNNFKSSAVDQFNDTEINALLRMDNTLTTQEESDTYDYLNAKY